MLDRAATLHTPDKTYHLRRAFYLSKTGDGSGAEKERQVADAQPLATPIDHFLAGREDFLRGAYASANRHFEFTRIRQPDHFWARCLSAHCALHLGQHQLAWDRLSECIRSEPDNAWLYVWRGLASMQLAARAAKDGNDEHFQFALDDYDRVLECLCRSRTTCCAGCFW